MRSLASITYYYPIAVVPYIGMYNKALNILKLTEADKEICRSKLTFQNCWEALNSMKKGKSPSYDDLTKKFYVYLF